MMQNQIIRNITDKVRIAILIFFAVLDKMLRRYLHVALFINY